MRCHSLRSSGRRVAVRRRQSETTIGKDKKGTFSNTILCASRLPRVVAKNDRGRSG
jgi:hypothetical protein